LSLSGQMQQTDLSCPNDRIGERPVELRAIGRPGLNCSASGARPSPRTHLHSCVRAPATLSHRSGLVVPPSIVRSKSPLSRPVRARTGSRLDSKYTLTGLPAWVHPREGSLITPVGGNALGALLQGPRAWRRRKPIAQP